MTKVVQFETSFIHVAERMSARVVGLDQNQDDVERLPQLGHFAEMVDPHRQLEHPFRHLDPQPVGAHLLDVRRPLLDQGHVEPRRGEIGGDGGAVGAGAEDGYPLLVHYGLKLPIELPFSA